MKVVKTVKGQYVCVPDSIISDLPKKQIESIFNTLPKEAKPNKQEMKIIKNLDTKLEHLKENYRKYMGVIRPAMGYNHWTCVTDEYLSENGVEDFRNCYIEYDVDIDYDLTAILIIDFTNERYLVELRQGDITLPYTSEECKEEELAINILTEYIYNPEEYADYL